MSLWNIELNEYNKYDNEKYETIFTLANGYKGLRGALEFSKVGNKGNLIAGVFDKSYAQVTEIVNCQDPLGFNIYIEDELVDIDECNIHKFNRTLNMKEGVLYSEIYISTKSGKTMNIKSERLVSRNNVHRWASRYEISPGNFSGKVFIENIIDGTVTNSTKDPMSRAKHFQVVGSYDLEPGMALLTKTFDKNIQIIEATRIISEKDNGNAFKFRKYSEIGEKVVEVYETFLKKDNPITIYKYGTSYTSRDTQENLISIASKDLQLFVKEGYLKEKQDHIKVWENIWEDTDIKIVGDDLAQLGIRFNLYHLSSSAYEGDDKVSLAAKALHGEGYKGHVFWDTETFMLPYFIYTRPQVAKCLLMYRYNTLKGARKNAELTGYKGARFPWESADDGMEVTPKWGFDYDGNPVRIWTGDEEYHINSDIVFAIVEYYRATGDKDFIIKYGLEILLDTTKFWQSRVEYNKEEDRYEINCVIGPDEFHEHVNNNVFTNYLAKWSIKKTLEFAEWVKTEDESVLKTLCNKLGITEEDFHEWNEIQKKIYIPTSQNGIIIEQFQGYFNLADIPIIQHDENGMPMWPNLGEYKLGETQLVKQADVVQLMIMLSEEFSQEIIKANYEYYEARTMHKSSLSPSMYSILGLTVGDTHNAYKYFIKALYTDLRDNQGNTDFGLHAASTGGSWQSAIFGFAGLKVSKEGDLSIKPWIPEHWRCMEFNINWRDARINIRIEKENIFIKSDKHTSITVYEKKINVLANNFVKIPR
ncbi:kojibiose phosphorylase [Clostridium amylolyticum]|uniref:Kojibiose phosphorylase n=1 Tax=Clostridium amylolyticum TaxID=1121298 RepID=A0A1M6C734_9CLOT|nr:glycosyl hydrolase family 65 protein [Clostridium amylolyticum]SHI56850.1 kojibiose phosphorylase [Clostridium amylolyticum]